MKEKHTKKEINQNPRSEERVHFSRAVMEVAKNNLKEFKSKTDEAFITRAKIDRKLRSL